MFIKIVFFEDFQCFFYARLPELRKIKKEPNAATFLTNYYYLFAAIRRTFVRYQAGGIWVSGQVKIRIIELNE